MAYKVPFLFLALMLLVASCRSEEVLDDQDAFYALKDLMEREARGNDRKAEICKLCSILCSLLPVTMVQTYTTVVLSFDSVLKNNLHSTDPSKCCYRY